MPEPKFLLSWIWCERLSNSTLQGLQGCAEFHCGQVPISMGSCRDLFLSTSTASHKNLMNTLSPDQPTSPHYHTTSLLYPNNATQPTPQRGAREPNHPNHPQRRRGAALTIPRQTQGTYHIPYTTGWGGDLPTRNHISAYTRYLI